MAPIQEPVAKQLAPLTVIRRPLQTTRVSPAQPNRAETILRIEFSPAIDFTCLGKLLASDTAGGVVRSPHRRNKVRQVSAMQSIKMKNSFPLFPEDRPANIAESCNCSQIPGSQHGLRAGLSCLAPIGIPVRMRKSLQLETYSPSCRVLIWFDRGFGPLLERFTFGIHTESNLLRIALHPGYTLSGLRAKGPIQVSPAQRAG